MNKLNFILLVVIGFFVFISVGMGVRFILNQEELALPENGNIGNLELFYTFNDTKQILDFEVHDNKLYVLTDIGIYTYDGKSWNSLRHPDKYVCDLEVYKGKLYSLLKSESTIVRENSVGTEYFPIIFVYNDKNWELFFDPTEGKYKTVKEIFRQCDNLFNNLGLSDLSDYLIDGEIVGSKLYAEVDLFSYYVYDGKKWTKESPTFFGSILSNFGSTAVYKDEIYLAGGLFVRLDSSPGVLIFRNGEWQPVLSSPLNLVYSLFSYGDYLYAVALYDVDLEGVDNNLKAELQKYNLGLVFRYNGNSWSVFAETKDPIGPSVVYNNKIYIGGFSAAEDINQASIYILKP